jgi:hypothetical protein
LPEEILRVVLDAPRQAVKTHGDAIRFWVNEVSQLADSDQDADHWWIDPTRHALMLKPLQLEPDFSISDDTVPRLRKTDFDYSLTPADHWEEVGIRFADDYYLQNDGTDETVTTKTTYERNRPFWFSFYVHGQHNDVYKVVELTFGAYRLDIWSSGKCDLFQTGVFRATGNLCMRHGDSLNQQMIDLMILPCSRRSILFWSNKGWWVHNNYLLPIGRSDTGDYTITSAGKFSFRFPSSKAVCQFMPLRFQPIMEFTTAVNSFHRPPSATQEVNTHVFTDAFEEAMTAGIHGTAELLEESADTTFVPDGAKHKTRLRWSVTAWDPAAPPDPLPLYSDWTGFIYGANVEFAGEVDDTEDNSVDIADDILEITLGIPDNIEGESLTVKLKNADQYGPEASPGIENLSHRQIQVFIGAAEIWRGVTGDVWREESANPNASIGGFNAKSIYSDLLQRARLADAGSFGGMTHLAAMKFLTDHVGIHDSLLQFEEEVSPDLIPMTEACEAHGRERNAWSPELGDTCWEWARRINDFKADWILDSYPSGGFYLLRYTNEASLATTPVKTLYLDASTTPGEWQKWVRECKYAMIEPEVNELWVRGCNDRGETMIAVFLDADSQNPMLALEERQDNWLGCRQLGHVPAPHIRTMADLVIACKGLARKTTKAIRLATWTAQWTPGLWRNDVVELSGVGNYRITDMKIRFQLENEGMVLRPCEFVGRRMPDVS